MTEKNEINTPDLVLPPQTEGYPQSAQYRVYVNGYRCPVYDTRVFFELNNQNRTVSFKGGCRVIKAGKKCAYPSHIL